MGLARLYGTLTLLTLIFSASMAFACLGVYNDEYWPAGAAGGALILFALIAGAVVPGPLRALSGGYRKVAWAAVAMFGSWWGLELFVMALITWALGKRLLSVSVGASNGYQTLGIFIFLGLVGVGIGGALAMTAFFLYLRNQSIVAPSRLAERLREREQREPLLRH